MIARALAKWRTGVAPTRQFAVLSLVLIALITVALSLVISYYLRKDLLDREWGVTADYVRTEVAYHLTLADFESPSSEVAKEHFRSFYEQTIIMPEIVRLKIYDRTATVVWSDEERLIGNRFPDNRHLAEALGGRIVAEIARGEKSEHVYERGVFPYLVEVYVPIVFPDAAQVAGVVEAYKVPEQVFANIRKGQITVAATALAGGLLLYLSLFRIFRRATHRIEAQRQALEGQSQDLASANQELLAAQDQLVAGERMAALGEAVALVAHGMRSPLANIRVSAQVALAECNGCTVSVQGPTHLANTISEVDRLQARLKELLQFVRPAERQTRPVDLNTALRGTLETVAGRLEKADVKVDEQLAPALPLIVGDAVLFEQVFMSLIENAIEAMPGGGGTITLVTGTERDASGVLQVFAEVRDTGVGIPSEEIPKILNSFYSTKAYGTGLGLTVAKKFTEAYSGAISVSSNLGQGSVFRLTFPAQGGA